MKNARWCSIVVFLACASVASAGSPSVHCLGRYFGFGWGAGYHGPCDVKWYASNWGPCCNEWPTTHDNGSQHAAFSWHAVPQPVGLGQSAMPAEQRVMSQVAYPQMMAPSTAKKEMKPFDVRTISVP